MTRKAAGSKLTIKSLVQEEDFQGRRDYESVTINRIEATIRGEKGVRRSRNSTLAGGRINVRRETQEETDFRSELREGEQVRFER